MWILGKDIEPSEGWWWAAMPTWEWPMIVYMAKLGDSPWKIQTMVRTEVIEPYMMFKKIERPSIPKEGNPVFIESMEALFGTANNAMNGDQNSAG